MILNYAKFMISSAIFNTPLVANAIEARHVWFEYDHSLTREL